MAELLAKAEAADQADAGPTACQFPRNWHGARSRLEKIAEARARIEARAQERFKQEQAEYQAKLAVREANAEATGKKLQR